MQKLSTKKHRKEHNSSPILNKGEFLRRFLKICVKSDPDGSKPSGFE